MSWWLKISILLETTLEAVTNLSTLNSTEYRVVSDFCTGYAYIGGVDDGMTSDFVNRNINQEQDIEVPPP